MSGEPVPFTTAIAATSAVMDAGGVMECLADADVDAGGCWKAWRLLRGGDASDCMTMTEPSEGWGEEG